MGRPDSSLVEKRGKRGPISCCCDFCGSRGVLVQFRCRAFWCTIRPVVFRPLHPFWPHHIYRRSKPKVCERYKWPLHCCIALGDQDQDQRKIWNLKKKKSQLTIKVTLNHWCPNCFQFLKLIKGLFQRWLSWRNFLAKAKQQRRDMVLILSSRWAGKEEVVKSCCAWKRQIEVSKRKERKTGEVEEIVFRTCPQEWFACHEKRATNTIKVKRQKQNKLDSAYRHTRHLIDCQQFRGLFWKYWLDVLLKENSNKEHYDKDASE